MNAAALNQIKYTNSFEEFIATPFQGNTNAICWNRELKGNFEEIVNNIEVFDNLTEINETDLLNLDLSAQGQIARKTILDDFEALEKCGASPSINIIKAYKRDENYTVFPTDVYSFHVDSAPIETDTILCTYYGAASDIIANEQATQKIKIEEIRNELKKLFSGKEEDFEEFLNEHFFDLHYQANENATITNLGNGKLWRLAVQHPNSKVLPCIHRAPKEKEGQKRLLLIC